MVSVYARFRAGVSDRAALRKRAGRDAFKREFYGLDGSVGVEVHPLDARAAVVAVGLGQRTAMVDDVPFVGSRNVHDAVVSRTSGDVQVRFDDFPDPFVRTEE